MENIEKVLLPSNGLLNAPMEVVVRSLTGGEISTIYSSFTDASIDKVIRAITEPSLNPEDLCDKDKAFILHKARVLTIGNEIEQTLRCPICGFIESYNINYKGLKIEYLDSEYLTKEIILSNGDIIRPRIPSAKILADINRYKDKVKLAGDFAYLLVLISKIESVSGNKRSIPDMVSYLDNLPGLDVIKLGKELEVSYGLDTTFSVNCPNCDSVYTGGLGISADLFR